MFVLDESNNWSFDRQLIKQQPHFAPTNVFFYLMDQPRLLLSFIFGLFKQTSLQYVQQIYVKYVRPVYSDGIWPLTIGREYAPITTRPGLPPSLQIVHIH